MYPCIPQTLLVTILKFQGYSTINSIRLSGSMASYNYDYYHSLLSTPQNTRFTVGSSMATIIYQYRDRKLFIMNTLAVTRNIIHPRPWSATHYAPFRKSANEEACNHSRMRLWSLLASTPAVDEEFQNAAPASLSHILLANGSYNQWPNPRLEPWQGIILYLANL
jgi:hypothetical protein